MLLRCQRRGRNTAWPSMPPARWKSAGPGPHTQCGSGIGTGRGLDELPTAYRPRCLAQAGGTQPDKGGEPPRTACRPRCRAQAGARMGLHAHQGKSGVELSISHGMRRTRFCSHRGSKGGPAKRPSRAAAHRHRARHAPRRRRARRRAAAGRDPLGHERSALATR